MTLVAGVDSSTQSCKVVVRDAESGALVREGRAAHPDGTEVDPEAWWHALTEAASAAGGLDDVEAVSVAAQQHGMVLLDDAGDVVRPALLWNDTRSAAAAADLVDELGAAAWSDAVGSVPVASFTVTKLRWVARARAGRRRPRRIRVPAARLADLAARRRRGTGARPVTDRGDASGTGYWSPSSGKYRDDLLVRAFGRSLDVPAVLGPSEAAGEVATDAPFPLRPGALRAPGTGDNMAAALGVGAQPGDVVVSIGTSGTVFAVSATPTHDASGAVAGFADAAGGFLPLACTLNAAQVLDTVRGLLGVDHAEFDRLALSAPSGSGGLVLLPYLVGERTPNRPDATGTLAGVTLVEPLARGRGPRRGGGGAVRPRRRPRRARRRRVWRCRGWCSSAAARGPRRSVASRPRVLGHPVVVPKPGEYVADGAAVQAAWVLAGERPGWAQASGETYDADPTPAVRAAYATVRDT